jgi:hypothetical protein
MTLIEVTVVVALSSIVMGIVISLTVALKQKDRAMRAFAVESERLSELSETLRTDVRRANDLSRPADTMLVMSSPNNSQIQYELTASGCRRTVTKPGEAPTHVDLFAIGPAASWTIEQGPRGRRPLYIVTLHRLASAGDGESRVAPMLVYAALGADLPPTAIVSPTE